MAHPPKCSVEARVIFRRLPCSFLLFLSFAMFSTRPAAAQEFSFLAGGMSTVTSNRVNALAGPKNEMSYAWEIDYRHEFDRHFAWSASWLNEGHTASHHRDGFATQAWIDLLSFDHVEFGVGA